MIRMRTLILVARYFVAHRDEMTAELLERQRLERERLGCPRLREMLHARGREKRKQSTGFNDYGFITAARFARETTEREAA